MDMGTIYLVAGLAIAFTILLALYRAVFGPGVFNQAVAMNVIGTKVIVLIIVIGYVFERPVFVDIALLYGVLNFIATLIMAKYLEKGEICSA